MRFEKLEMFNGTYFFYLLCFGIFLIICLLFLKNKTEAFRKRFISGLLFFSLIVHFCKLLFPPYVDDPYAFRKITPENICALSTLVFPFIFLGKHKYLKDYMFYIGLLSGTLAVVFPLEAFDKPAFIFDTVRFYVCHIIITVAPLLMVAFGLHKLDYHRIYRVPLQFLVVLAIIMLNEIILIEIGLVPLRSDDLFDPNAYRNFSFIFGVPENFSSMDRILNFFTPAFCLHIPFGEYAGAFKYWPLVWLIMPVYVYIGGLSLLLSIFWEHKHMHTDLIRVKNYFVRNFTNLKL